MSKPSKIEFVFADHSDLSQDVFKTFKQKLEKFGVKLYDILEGSSDSWAIAICTLDITKEQAKEVFDKKHP